MSGYQIPTQTKFQQNPIYAPIAPCQTLKQVTVETLDAAEITSNAIETNELVVSTGAYIHSAYIDVLDGPVGEQLSLLELRDSYDYPQNQDLFNEAVYSDILLYDPPAFSLYEILAPQVYNINVARDLIIPGTEVATGGGNAIVYAYPTSSGSIISLTTGSNYSDTYEGTNFIVASPYDSECIELFKKDANISNFSRAMSYYQQRGFASPNAEFNPDWENFFGYVNQSPSQTQVQFIFPTPTLQFKYIGFKPIIDETNNITDLQLFAVVHGNDILYQTLAFVASTTPAPYCLNLVSIPVTKSYDEFLLKVANKEPIVFNDLKKMVLNIHVEAVNLKVSDTQWNPNNVPTFPKSHVVVYMKKFIGSFAGVARTPIDSYVFSNYVPNLAGYVQVSNNVSIDTKLVIDGVDYIQTVDNPILGAVSQSYNGFILAAKNYHQTGFKCTINQSTIGNAYNYLDWDSVLRYPTYGANTSTKVQTPAAIDNLIQFFNSDITVLNFQVEPSYLENPGFPEDNPSIPPDTMVKTYDPLINSIVAHELYHSTTSGYGTYFSVDAEAQAVTAELDVKLTYGSTVIRSISYLVGYLLPLYRASWQLGFEALCLSYNNPNPYILPPGFPLISLSYGEAMFYTFVRQKYDLNLQLPRRACEIMAFETYGPLAAQDEFATFVPTVCNTISTYLPGYNAAGARLAYQQAMQELYSMDIEQVFKDWAIAVSVLRNNLAIPSKYRVDYPWWMYSASNSNDMAAVLDISYYGEYFQTLFAQTALWWDQVNSPTGSMNVDFVNDFYGPEVGGQSLCPSWPRYVSGSSGDVTLVYDATGDYVTSYSQDMMDMSMSLWIIPETFNSVTVTANSGTISAAVFKFVSDGGNTGTWLMTNSDNFTDITVSSSETFNLAPFQALSGGYTRLVITNTSIVDYGGWNNFFADQLYYTGNYTISHT